MTTGKVTTDHDTIQRWIERRGGKPARVRSTSDRGGGGPLRVDFPDRSGEDHLEAISWESFFETFDKRNLAFLYQDETADGYESRFSRFVERETASAPAEAGAGPGHDARGHRGGAAGGHKKPARPHARA